MKNIKSKLIIDKKGTKRWRLPNGKYHREDGPAIEYEDGFKSWYINGKLHRKNRPAVDSSNKKEYRIDGKLHREYGPAIIYSQAIADQWYYGQTIHWYLNDKGFTEQEFKIKMRLKKLKFILN